MFVYCAVEGGDKPRVCEHSGSTRKSAASGGAASGPGVTVRIWRVNPTHNWQLGCIGI